ncbi:translation initiation factor IF-2-like [Cebus imitator]|uniref:translation initiation factor IF-2-like n=1 Tax=Cebus imitator TaxID=2715852 RepID=UPI00080A4B9B|nr:translation initiation factor IF-2-like [Cebus imitator]
MISTSTGESDKAKGSLTRMWLAKTSKWMGERQIEACAHSGSPSPAEGRGTALPDSCCCQSDPIGHSDIHSNISWAPRRFRGNVRWRKASVYPPKNPVIRPSGNPLHLRAVCVSVSEVSLFADAIRFSSPPYQRTGGPPRGGAGVQTRRRCGARDAQPLHRPAAKRPGGGARRLPEPKAASPAPLPVGLPAAPAPRPAPPGRRGPGRDSRTKAGPRAGTQGRESQEGCQRPGPDPRPKSRLVPAPPGPTRRSAGLQAGPKPQPSFFRLNKIPCEPAASKPFYRVGPLGCRVGLKDSTGNRGCWLCEELIASAGTGRTPRVRGAGGRRRSLSAAPPAATCPLSTKRVAQAQAGGRVPASVRREERTR